MISSTSARTAAEIARQAQLSREIARGQTDVSSLKRLHVASDDPTAAARVAEIRRTQANETQWAANVEDGAATATRVDATLANTATQIDRARELMISVKNGTLSPDARTAIAAELFGIADDVSDAASTADSRGRALFPAGQAVQLPIGDGVTLAATVSREEAFGDLPTLLREAAAAAANGDIGAAQGQLERLTARNTSIATVRAAQGARAARFDAAREALSDSGLNLAEERGLLEDTDLASTVAAIQSKLTSLQIAQAVFAKINGRSLFDLL